MRIERPDMYALYMMKDRLRKRRKRAEFLESLKNTQIFKNNEVAADGNAGDA
jgi:hypothetical protein